MEILAENRYVMTKALFLEGLNRMSRDSYGKTAKKCTIGLMLLWVVMTGLLLAIGGTFAQSLVYLAAIGFVCLWLNVLAPRKQAKKSWNALLSRCGENSQRSTCFFDDHLEISTDGFRKTIPYSDIVKILRTKQLYVLVCRDKMGVMVTKDGFVTGSAEQIMALIDGAEK